uniref:Uncharacterized protein n=1 Tax=Arundo donax TaxID=35708 RepID=A0A0A9BAA9_ARUDO
MEGAELLLARKQAVSLGVLYLLLTRDCSKMHRRCLGFNPTFGLKSHET